MPNLKSIPGVEIFAAGTWNGDTYSIQDLDEMVRAFSELKGTVKPSLKLGHTDRQKLIQKDGLPAAGWIGNLYRAGEKLLADFVDIPDKIYQLLKNKAYRKVSSEIYWNIDINGKKYPRMLSAVALLGADMPAVTTLNDILAMYGFVPQEIKSYAQESEDTTVKTYSYESEGSRMTKTELETKLEAELEAQKSQVKTYEQAVADKDAALAAKDAEVAELKKFKQEAEEKAAAAAKEAEEAKQDQFLTELQSEKIASPAMKPYIKALLGEEKKEYSIGEKKLNKSELLKEILKLHSAAIEVNFEESSEEGKQESATGVEAQLEKIEKYASEHKVSHGEAYKAVMREKA